MKTLNVLGSIGTAAVKLMTMGLVTLASDQLRDTNRNISKDMRGQVGRGYEYYAKPKLVQLTTRKK